MDNSHRYSNEDTTTSMYLSFDAESTTSTACYKTLEAMSDVSSVSNFDNSVIQNKTNEDMNNTLELNDKSPNISPLKTVKKIESLDVKLNSPLKAFQKNILREYKALSSTPSRDLLLKNIELTRGSDATRCVELGLAFLGVEDDGPVCFNVPPMGLDEENKENALPDIEEVSTLSTCSSTEATSVIEKKMLTSISNIGSIIEEEFVEATKPSRNAHSNNLSVDVVDKSSNIIEPNIFSKKAADIQDDNFKITANAEIADVEFVDGIIGTMVPQKNISLDQERKIEENVKKIIMNPKNSALSQNARRTICEPNLLTNKPSRIVNSNNMRRSLLPTCKKSAISTKVELEIPQLMNKILKISNSMESNKNGLENKTPAPRDVAVSSVKTRNSLIPSTATTKRPFGFTQRMSVVVKTTLNSPARKIPRRSVMGGNMPQPYRSNVIPKKITMTDSSNNANTKMLHNENSSKTLGTNTCSSNIQSKSNTQASLKSTISNSSTTQRKSLFAPARFLEKPKMSIGGISKTIQDNLYICNVCKEKFRIKSLLDAHKRSHESDNIAPAFVKKPSSLIQPTCGTVFKNTNQCKYCDKKFALIKALHIHLLQNCTKIPPCEKRKLEYTELNHVEKAQLPNVFPHNSLQSSGSSAASSVCSTPRYTLTQHNIITKSKHSTEFSNENKDTQNTNAEKNITSSSAVQKVKKVTAHSGIYKTPSKAVPCHLCKLTFTNILDYTNHNLTIHASHKTSASHSKSNDVKKSFSDYNV